MNDYDGCMNLLVAIIDNAVDDFENGFVMQRRDAAAFFRGPDAKWMCNVVGATVEDLIENRLSSDPSIPILTGREQYKATCPGILIEYKGRAMTMSDWARETKVNIDTLRTRIKKWGVGPIAFHPGRVNKFGHLL